MGRPFAKFDWPGRDQYPDTGWDQDHTAAFCPQHLAQEPTINPDRGADHHPAISTSTNPAMRRRRRWKLSTRR